jgi:purine nucleoside phosphorylase
MGHRDVGDAAVAEESYAESLTYKAQGYDVIGMTNMPEAKLAREAEITSSMQT